MLRRLPPGLLCALVLLVLMLTTRAARADIAPDPGYVEPCTVEKVRGPDEACEACRADHGDPEACSNSLGKDGYARRCRTRGASVWGEVWCKKAPDGGAPSPTDPTLHASSTPAPQTSGCAVSGTGPAAALPVVLALVGLAVCRRRR